MALRQALRTWGTQRTRGLAALASSESDIKEKLLRHFPGNQIVEVQDTSGGCGTFYSIRVIADEFKGKSVIEQHKMINSILKVRAMRGGYGRSICQGDARIEWPAEEMLVRLKGMNAWTVNHRKDKICLESGLPANATIDCFKIRNVFAVKALQKQCIHASPL